MTAIVLEMARRPVPGRVKTRLAATEGDVEAARIYRFLAETVHAALLRAQTAGTLEVALCLPPGDDEAETPWLAGARHRWSQGDGDLGARLDRVLRHAFEGGASVAFAVGTDVVGVDEAFVERAIDALDTADVVVAPTPDGGYGLIGMRSDVALRALPVLFDGIPWSSPGVMPATRRRARKADLRIHEIHGLRDVDVAADLDGAIPLVSILVPVWNEAERVEHGLSTLLAMASFHETDVEVVVADGGSDDGSGALARALGATVVDAPRGRGTQLRAAAAVARGRWLWTLHVDAALPEGAIERVLAWCRRAPRPWAACASRFDDPALALRLIECLTDGRARVLRRPYGDQGILVRRTLYDAVGGYADVPLMEDVILARALAKHGEPGRLPVEIRVDARRWRRHGVLGTSARNLWTLFRFLVLGTDPRTLASGYARGE